MIKRILASLEERRRNLKDEDKGFTLIELLVVVIIIGILVAIAIPVYIGLQNGAKEAATQSDLKNAKIAIVAYYTTPGSAAIPAGTDLTTVAALPPLGLVRSSETTAGSIKNKAAITTAGAFCIDAVSSTGADYSISATGEVSTSPCP